MRLTRRYARTASIVMLLIPAAFGLSAHKIWVDTGSTLYVTVLLIAGFLFTSVIAMAVCWRFGEAVHLDQQENTANYSKMIVAINESRIGQLNLGQKMTDQRKRYVELEAANEELKNKLREFEAKAEEERVHREQVSDNFLNDLKTDKREREGKRKARKKKCLEKATPLRRDKDGEIVEVCEVILDNDDMTDW